MGKNDVNVTLVVNANILYYHIIGPAFISLKLAQCTTFARVKEISHNILFQNEQRELVCHCSQVLKIYFP